MKILVMMTSWNYPQYTIPCVHTIKRAVGDLEHKIFIVDNGSSPENLNKVGILKDLGNVEIFQNPINGYYIARNIAFKKAVDEEFDFICCSDNDILYLPRAIENMVNLGSNPKVGTISPMQTYAGGAGYRHQYAYLPPEIWTPLRKRMEAGKYDDSALLQWYKNNWEYPKGIGQEVKVTDATCNIFKTELIRKIGYIDEKLGISGQRWEQDWGYRTIQAGYKWMVCKSAFICHFNLSTITIARQDHYSRDGDKPHRRMKEKYGNELAAEIGAWTKEAVFIGGHPDRHHWVDINKLSNWIPK